MNDSNVRPLVLIIALADFVALLLIALKVVGWLGWPWILVTSPFWGQFACVVTAVAAVNVAAVIIGFVYGGER